MKKKIVFKSILIVGFLLTFFQTSAQNLVPNSSFEDTLGCPYQWDGIQMGLAANWFQPTYGSSDLFTTCFLVPQSFNGYQFANTGKAYGGFMTTCNATQCDPTNINREYLSVRLLDSLESGVTYYGKFSVSRADSVNYASNFGVLLSDSLHLESSMNLPYIPQYEINNPHTDRLNWTEYTFSFVANGGESFLTIGNFRDEANQVQMYIGDGTNDPIFESYISYYYIDDVCISRDITKCKEVLGLNDYYKPDAVIVKYVNSMGVETVYKPNTLLFAVYTDGSIKKIINIE